MNRSHPVKQALALLLFSFFFLSGCSGRQAESPTDNSAQPVTSAFFAMDTVMELTLYGGEAQLDAALTYIEALEAALSVTREDSEIYAVNHSGSGVLSAQTAGLLDQSLALCSRSGGALDLSIYPVVRAWGFTTGEYRVPDPDELTALLANVDYTRILLDMPSGRVDLPDGMEIDLGSVAKGYAGDCVTELLRENGVTSALLNLGGNVQALGAKPDGSPWRVAVRDPFGSGYAGILEIADQAVVTSGGYERYFAEDGRTYWHILDPADGTPAHSGLASVTIVGSSGLVCDGLSTALFVMGLENAAGLWRNSDDFEAVLIAEDGRIYITEGLENTFSLSDGQTDTSDMLTVIRRG
ncbi:MAG: FAD:protein FMN transferase [Butyricicoccaceae bacterium]